MTGRIQKVTADSYTGTEVNFPDGSRAVLRRRNGDTVPDLFVFSSNWPNEAAAFAAKVTGHGDATDDEKALFEGMRNALHAGEREATEK